MSNEHVPDLSADFDETYITAQVSILDANVIALWQAVKKAAWQEAKQE